MSHFGAKSASDPPGLPLRVAVADGRKRANFRLAFTDGCRRTAYLAT